LTLTSDLKTDLLGNSLSKFWTAHDFMHFQSGKCARWMDRWTDTNSQNKMKMELTILKQ